MTRTSRFPIAESRPAGLAVDAGGNAYATGTGVTDAFVAKLNPARRSSTRRTSGATTSTWARHRRRPVTRLRERLVRPHDVMLLADPADDATEAIVRRVVHLGFDVRVELELPDDEIVSAHITRQQAEELELRAGDLLYVRDGLAPRVSA